MGKGSESTKLVEGSTEAASDSSKTPVSGKDLTAKTNFISWKDVEAHANKTDCWIVLNECVYDLAKFKRRHPGGVKLLEHFAGQDATVSHFCRFHCSYGNSQTHYC